MPSPSAPPPSLPAAPPLCPAPEPPSDSFVPFTHPDFARVFVFCLLLVAFGGIMSGLQQAIMRVSQAELTSMRTEGGDAERKIARLLQPLINRRHLTLVTLLVGNALAMEALPVFIDILVPKAVAIALSVTAVVLFGEILPQAICLKWPMELAAFFSWLMYFLVAVLYPVAAPIAGLLDWMLGHNEDAILTRGGLREFAIMHGEVTRGGPLNQDELGIILGALDLHKKHTGDTGTPLDQVFMISMEALLNDATLAMIAKAGHSRVPVYKGEDRSNVVGLLLVKQLVRLGKQVLVKDLDAIFPVLVAGPGVSLFALLKRFCTGESHMAVVVDTVDTEDGIRLCDYRKHNSDAVNVVRIVTLEDVLETLLRKDIQDEKDLWKTNLESDLDSRLSRARLLKRDLSTMTNTTVESSLSMHTAYGTV
jgi:metal transporter CNNM